MIYATHQANAYDTPEELDRAIIECTGNFLRASWEGSPFQDVEVSMINDITMGGTHNVASVYRGRGLVTLTCGRTISADGYVTPPK